ncbi:MAG: cytochrome c nitrite reductase small subunit [Tepidisphaerales bacterium]
MRKPSFPGKSGKLMVVVAAMAGVMLGLGLYTFNYAEGLSYFSKDPKACANCHIMRDEYDAWRKSSHHANAVCVDCHLPHEIVPKLIAKADNGYRHSKGFTFQDFHEPIMIKTRSGEILQENCVRCHGGLVHELVNSASSARGEVRCVHCHAYVGHGPRR